MSTTLRSETEAGGRRRTIAVEHLARVEGHGGIKVTMDDRRIESVHFDVFEGIRLLEALIGGRSWEDVSPIVSRICAICSVAHSLTSIRATERVFGITPGRRTELLRDLMWRGENIESHALHLFLLAAPDYLGFPSAPAMATAHPQAVALGLRLKELGNRIQTVVGGRAIHPVNAVPGGFGRVPDEETLIELKHRLVESRHDVAAAIEMVAGLPATRPLDTKPIYVSLRMDEDWRYDRGDVVVVATAAGQAELTVDQLRARLSEEPVPHSHAKHSALDGRPFMVGALARITANLERLPARGREAARVLGIPTFSLDPLDNNKAQAVELAVDLDRAAALVDGFLAAKADDAEPLPVTPRAGRASILTEAPRGCLLHEYEYDGDGRIAAANVITPTAFNAAHLEAHFRAAVARDGAEDEEGLRHTLSMIARAYDPCISCSVHLARRR